MTQSLSGKIALVTGGGTGLGRAIATALVAAGARTYIVGRRADVLQAAAEQIGAVPIVADIMSAGALDGIYREIGQRDGRLDILVANAGVTKSAELEQSTEADYHEIMDLNVKALYFTVQRALPLLQQGASVILLGSSASHIIRKGNALYSASKSAVRSLARTWALELGEKGIRVNVISPGATQDTPLMDLALSSEAGRARIAGYMEQIPLKRMGRAEEVAGTLLFLVSPAGAYITGAEIPVDGGLAQV